MLSRAWPWRLLGERPVGIVAREDVEAVPVQFQRQATLPAGVVEDRDVAMQILLGPEAQGQRRGGGIVDQPMQRRPGAAVLEPGVRAGVELGELADPARGTSLLLIEKVSMGGPFYRTAGEDNSILAAARSGRPLDLIGGGL